MADRFTDFLNTLIYLIKSMSFIDILDIGIVAYLIFYVLRFVKGTSIASIFKGIVILIISLYLSEFLKLNAIHFILSNTMQIGLVALIIMFQPELRRLLESLGNSKISGFIRRQESEGELSEVISEVADACGTMSWSKTGALIIFERKNLLDTVVTGATIVDAKPTSELIRNIFFVKAPLHDGAMIIRGDRILSAGCVLPLTDNEELPTDLGTRHRAGIGISEVSDAISLIVSEETGTISMAINGQIKRELNSADITSILTQELITANENPDSKTKSIFRFFKKGEENK